MIDQRTILKYRISLVSYNRVRSTENTSKGTTSLWFKSLPHGREMSVESGGEGRGRIRVIWQGNNNEADDTKRSQRADEAL